MHVEQQVYNLYSVDGNDDGNMAFPKYKNWILFKIPDGWEDRGSVASYNINFHSAKKEERWVHEVCVYCYTCVHIGKEQEILFKFCPKCLIQLTEK